MKGSNKRIHIVILLFLLVLSVGLSFAFNLNSLWSVILFMGLPSLYITALLPKSIGKSLAFGAIVSIPLIIIDDEE